MNLNHLDLPVPNTGEVEAFFVDHFGFRRIFRREDGLVVLLDEDGFALTLSPTLNTHVAQYPDGFHVGFNVDCEDDLFEVHRRMVVARVPIGSA